MDLYKRINNIIKEQNISKREFAMRLIALEPKLKSTSEIPTENTIYKYLNGTISIKVELISYIAEALRVTEQDLFTSDVKSRRNFFLNIIKTATEEEIEILKEKFDLSIENFKVETNQDMDNKKEELINLLSYAPKPLIVALIAKLKDIRRFTQLI